MGKVEKRDYAFVAGKRPQSRYISYQVRKRHFFAILELKNRTFAEAGSGQTYRKG